MPQTIDSKVACHQIAWDRRRKGLPSWKMHLRLVRPAPRGVPFGSIGREELISFADGLVKVLRDKLSAYLDVTNSDLYSRDLDEIVDDFAWLAEGPHKDTSDEEIRCTIAGRVDELYDFADPARILIEFNDP